MNNIKDFDLGQQAYFRGLSISDCPGGVNEKEWKEGFFKAEGFEIEFMMANEGTHSLQWSGPV